MKIFNYRYFFSNYFFNGKFTVNKFAAIIIFCLYVASSTINAQTIVTAKADTNQIKIGEQFHIKLSAKINQGTQVIFPFLPDTFNHFEIVNKSAIDTSGAKNKFPLTLNQQITLTAFDSGFFVIPPFGFVVKEQHKEQDSIFTEAMLMSVLTVQVDTTKDIRDIKANIEVPFPWQDYVLYVLIAIVIVVVIVYLVKKYAYREKPLPAKKMITRPAHEIAFENLKKIEEEKIWQLGHVKQYFSDVTDVLREYIEQRYSVFAKEQTSDEIMNHLNAQQIGEEQKSNLNSILRLADMVKFAKGQTMPADNERAMQQAYSFVDDTKAADKITVEKEREEKL